MAETKEHDLLTSALWVIPGGYFFFDGVSGQFFGNRFGCLLALLYPLPQGLPKFGEFVGPKKSSRATPIMRISVMQGLHRGTSYRKGSTAWITMPTTTRGVFVSSDVKRASKTVATRIDGYRRLETPVLS